MQHRDHHDLVAHKLVSHDIRKPPGKHTPDTLEELGI
jgi:hypothetical protein